jgi:hypothetical protein
MGPGRWALFSIFVRHHGIALTRAKLVSRGSLRRCIGFPGFAPQRLADFDSARIFFAD